jgi:arylsulfatase
MRFSSRTKPTQTIRTTIKKIIITLTLLKVTDGTWDVRPLNILLLYADDWRHDTLGVASNDQDNGTVQTPFLDFLARQGVRFRHNCVTTSICWISRATLNTGQFYSRHKQRLVQGPVYYYEYWNETYPGLLRNNGYYLGHVGKWHQTKLPTSNFDFWREYSGQHWIPSPNVKGGKIHVTKKNEQDAIEFLKGRPKDKPFCLTVAFFATHAEDQDPDNPWKPQPESMHLYVNETIPIVPSATKAAWERMPPFFDERNIARQRWHNRFDTEPRYQEVVKDRYRMATEVDAASQAIVQELQDQGLLNHTIIIFTADNGFFHAEHGLSDKFYPLQESIRVPLIIRDPRMSEPFIGTTNDAFTLSIDLAPTIVSAAGLRVPKRMQGRDISFLYRDVASRELTRNPWREEFYYELPLMNYAAYEICPSEALITKEFKYINWTYQNRQQLFDLQNDPWELTDIIDDTQHNELLQRLKERLRELREYAK